MSALGRYSLLVQQVARHHLDRTLKKAFVEPPWSVPYCISVCLAKSSAFSIGVSMRSTVRNAARLAVYVEIMMRVKNHQTLPTTRPDTDLTTAHRTG